MVITPRTNAHSHVPHRKDLTPKLNGFEDMEGKDF